MERRFGGAGGEALIKIINPKAVIFSIPSAVFVLLIMYFSASITQAIGLPMALSFLLIVLCSAPIIGAYGILSRNGDMDSGLGRVWGLRAEIASFTFRYWALALIWAGAASVAGVWVFERGVATGVSMNAVEFSFALRSIGFSAWMLLVLTLSVLSLALSLASEGVNEVFSPLLWSRLFGGKRPDLCSLLGITAGGMLIYYLMLMPFVILLVMFLLKINPALGLFANKFGRFVPFAFAPAVLGRLCGAFVSSVLGNESSGPAHRADAASPPAAPGKTGPSGSGIAHRPKPR